MSFQDAASPRFTILVQLVACANRKLDTCLKSVKLMLNNDRNNVSQERRAQAGALASTRSAAEDLTAGSFPSGADVHFRRGGQAEHADGESAVPLRWVGNAFSNDAVVPPPP